MTVYRFGGSIFNNCSVPLAFEGHYFIVEGGDPPLVSVALEREGQVSFEILRNQPGPGLNNVTKTAAGVVTVTDPETGRFLYKVRPGSETSIVFGRPTGEEGMGARVTDRMIQVGGNTFESLAFNGAISIDSHSVPDGV
jgi:hypothetical protein